jgi:two-component system sensor histidine kinase SenX3
LDAFAGRVAHDLRNPLSTVNLAGLTLAKQVESEDEAVTLFKRGINRMDSLIHDLLALSRAGGAPADICDPAKAVAGVYEDLSSRLERDGGTLNLNVAPARVRGSESLLRQAVWNLVDNAVKYRRPDVAVHVDLTGRQEREKYELRVSDNGIGMTPDEYPKAFDPFYRARRSRDVAGTGLGLSIVKRVVEASGGTVSVYSQLGQGTTFIINLPVAEDRQ